MTTPPSPIRLAVVDDHRMLLGALSEWIKSAADDVTLVAAVASWPELLTHPGFPTDVVLLDLDLKDSIPVSIKLATLASTGTKTVMMSTYSEPPVIREALNAGASGYLFKSEGTDMIVESIRAAHAGERFISPELSQALTAMPPGSPKLSAQERRVMALYANGEPVKSVAYALTISEETAKSYLKRIREKYRSAGVDVGTKVALRKQALRDGLILE